MFSEVTPCSIASIITFSQTVHAMMASTAFCNWNAPICFGGHAIRSLLTEAENASVPRLVVVRHRGVYACMLTAAIPCFRIGKGSKSVVFTLEKRRDASLHQAGAKALL
jgi:hypothetical protein